MTEGAAAAYTLSRTGATASSLTVSVSVTEDGAVLSGTSPAEAVFPADSGTSTLSVSTEDDEVAGDGGVVTVMVVTGNGVHRGRVRLERVGDGGGRRRGAGHHVRGPVHGGQRV